MNNSANMREMTMDQLKSWGECPVLIPVGAIEQHGPHMPLDTDAFLANKFCELAAIEIGAIVAPSFSYGCRSLPNSGGGELFTGTVGLRGITFSNLLDDISSSFVSKGHTNIAAISGHMENHGFAAEALRNVADRNSGVRTVLINWWEMIDIEQAQEIFHGQFPGWDAEHAGILETSIMLYIAPERVTRDQIMARKSEITPPNYVAFPERAGMVDPSGVLRTAHGASPEIGEALTREVVKNAVHILKREFMERS